MRFTAAIAAAGLAGAAVADHMGNSTMAASASDVYVTDVVTAYTTYCPNPTKITHKGETYTVSEATTLTITNCPGGCTVTKPASSAVVSVCSTCSSAPAVPETTAPAVETTPVPLPSPSGSPYYPSANGTNPTAPYGSGAPAGTGAPVGTGSSATASSTSPAYTGAANQAYLSASAGFLALFGLVAAL